MSAVSPFSFHATELGGSSGSDFYELTILTNPSIALLSLGSVGNFASNRANRLANIAASRPKYAATSLSR